MKPKITKGGGFGGASEYITDELKGQKDASRVSGNMLGITAEELTAEFLAVQQLRPEIRKPVWCCSLSMPAGEAALPDRKWDEIATDYMRRMGYGPLHPWVAFRHRDKDHDHIHIIASRIAADGELWSDSNDVHRAIALCQRMEKEHGLTVTKGLDGGRREKALVTATEKAMAGVDGESAKERVQRLILTAAVGGPTAPEFVRRLAEAGVTARPNIASTGTFNGFSYSVGGVSYKGSSLGERYKWGSLQTVHGVTYDPARDAVALAGYRAAPITPAAALDAAADACLVAAHAALAAEQRVDPAPQQPAASPTAVTVSVAPITAPARPAPDRATAPVEVRERLQRLVLAAATGRPTAPEFAQRLKDAGVQVTVNLASTGKLSGFAFALDGIRFTGSELGEKHKWSALQRGGVSYDPARDAGVLAGYRAAPAVPAPAEPVPVVQVVAEPTVAQQVPALATVPVAPVTADAAPAIPLRTIHYHYDHPIDSDPTPAAPDPEPVVAAAGPDQSPAPAVIQRSRGARGGYEHDDDEPEHFGDEFAIAAQREDEATAYAAACAESRGLADALRAAQGGRSRPPATHRRVIAGEDGSRAGGEGVPSGSHGTATDGGIIARIRNLLAVVAANVAHLVAGVVSLVSTSTGGSGIGAGVPVGPGQRCVVRYVRGLDRFNRAAVEWPLPLVNQWAAGVVGGPILAEEQASADTGGSARGQVRQVGAGGLRQGGEGTGDGSATGGKRAGGDSAGTAARTGGGVTVTGPARSQVSAGNTATPVKIKLGR